LQGICLFRIWRGFAAVLNGSIWWLNR
jgi:tryptophan-rich sensory protein